MPPKSQTPPKKDNAPRLPAFKTRRGDPRWDYYLQQGNPAAGRLGPVRAVNSYIHLSDDLFSADAALYYLYEEILDKDPHIAGMLSSRVRAVTSRDRNLTAASDDPADQRVRDFIHWALDNIGAVISDSGRPRFESLLETVLGAVGTGISIVELGWRAVRPDNPAARAALANLDAETGLSLDLAVIPVEFYERFPGRFVIDRDWQLFLSGPNPTDPLPPMQFLVTRFDPRHNNPYGNGLLGRMFWHYWFKKNCVRFWLQAAERTGAPALIGTYKGSVDDATRAQYLAFMESIVSSGIGVVPDQLTVDMLERRLNEGGLGGFKSLLDWVNEEITKLVAGATLVVSQGDRGAYALGQIHQDIRNEKVEGDARMAGDTINQLIRWIVDVNFGPRVAAPLWAIDTDEETDLKVEAEIDKALLKMGVPLTESYFYEHYGRPEPEEGDRTLNYDDGDLYQYHLAHGVLTVNEVRSRLGLEPVPWGDQPTNAPPPGAQPALPGVGPAPSPVSPRGRIPEDPIEDEPQPPRELHDAGQILRLSNLERLLMTSNPEILLRPGNGACAKGNQHG